jgi:magnesium-transporting ATPase (P-type)
MTRQPSKKTDKIVNEVMWRNILGHSIYQIALLMVILFFGRDWFGLPYENSFPLYVTDDWLATQSAEDIITYGLVSGEATNKCHMYTIVFQMFVMMQVFNMVNARKLLNDEYNVFADFFNNGRFLFILILIIVVQLALVQFGGRAFKCTPLTTVQQAICVACGAFTLIWALLIKAVLKPEWFMWINFDEDEMDDKEEAQTFQAQLRRSYRQSRTMRASSRVSARGSARKIDEDQ